MTVTGSEKLIAIGMTVPALYAPVALVDVTEITIGGVVLATILNVLVPLHVTNDGEPVGGV